MPDSLVLKPGGLIIEKNWKYDETIEKGDYEYTLISTGDHNTDSYLFSLLNTIVTLDDEFTVRDWFKLLINYPAFQELDLFIPDFLGEFYNCPEEGCLDPDGKIKEIVFQKIISCENYEPEKDTIYECEIYIDIYGLENNEGIHYGIDLLPISKYLDTPIKLSRGLIAKTIPILKEGTENKKNKKVSDYIYDHIYEEVKVNYTLFDFITSFIYEISFYGTPKKRNEKSKEICEMVQDIESGKVKTVPFNIDKFIKESEESEIK